MTPGTTYDPVNALWPERLPAITAYEAKRAARKLARHFKGTIRYTPRRCWISAKPLGKGVPRGWWRLVHDVAHIIFAQQNPGSFHNHSGWHAELEMQMVAYVIGKGWLEGALKPVRKPAPTTDERRLTEYNHAVAQVLIWEARHRRAASRIKAWKRRERELARRLRGAQVAQS